MLVQIISLSLRAGIMLSESLGRVGYGVLKQENNFNILQEDSSLIQLEF
jgi:hypothetical protein